MSRGLVIPVRGAVEAETFFDLLNRYDPKPTIAKYVLHANRIHDLNDPYKDTYCFIDGLQSQCSTCVLYDFRIGDGGTMRQLLSNAEEVAKWLNYTRILMSLTSGQRIEAAKKFGFKEIDSCVNRRTQNTVYFLMKEVAY